MGHRPHRGAALRRTSADHGLVLRAGLGMQGDRPRRRWGRRTRRRLGGRPKEPRPGASCSAPPSRFGPSTGSRSDLFVQGTEGVATAIADRLPPMPFPVWIQTLLVGISTGARGHRSYLFGQTSISGWWWFYLANLALKTTIGAQALGLLL